MHLWLSDSPKNAWQMWHLLRCGCAKRTKKGAMIIVPRKSKHPFLTELVRGGGYFSDGRFNHQLVEVTHSMTTVESLHQDRGHWRDYLRSVVNTFAGWDWRAHVIILNERFL